MTPERRTEELPAVQPDPNVIRFTLPATWRLPEVFAELQRRCGIVEPAKTYTSRNADGWTVKAVLNA